MCDVALRPIAVKVVGGVPAENQAEVISNAVAGRVGRPRLRTVSTQTDNADGESVRLSDYDKDQDFYFQDLEEDGDSVQLDFAPYGGLRWQRQYEAADRRYDSQPDDYRCQLFLDQFADAVAAVVESDVDDASTNSSHVEYEVSSGSLDRSFVDQLSPSYVMNTQRQPELECEFIPLSVTASTWVSSSKTANTTTTTSSSSSGCSMSPPDDFDHSTIHTPSDRTTDSLNTPYSSGHGLTGSSTSTNCHRQFYEEAIQDKIESLTDPDNVAGATTKVQLEMVELGRQLARIRLRCRDLVASTSGTSPATTSTVTSVSSSSSTRTISSTDWDWHKTPPRRAAVPRMGVRRHCVNLPVEDSVKDTGAAPPREVAGTIPVTTANRTSPAHQSNSSRHPVAACTGHRCCNDSNNTTSPSKGICVRQLLKPDNTTPVSNNAVVRDSSSTLSHFSTSSTLVASTRRPAGSENTAPIISSAGNSSAPDQSNIVSQNSTSTDTRCMQCDRLPSNDGHPPNISATSRSPTSAKDTIVDAASKSDRVLSKNTSSTLPHQLNSSSAAARIHDDDRIVQEIGNPSHSNVSTDRTSVRSRETVTESVNCSSQTDEVDAERRRRSQRQELYWRYADVMYTNPDNLKHTIAVQQALFRQQLDGSEARQLPAGGGSPSRPPDREMEWVIKRRADGSRYITRRPAKHPPGWRTERRRTAEERRRRQSIETTDDGRSDSKAGRYWTRNERRRQVQERRGNRDVDQSRRTTDLHSSSTEKTAVELGREKILRHQNANQLDAFTTLAELMSLGHRDTTVQSETRTYGRLLSVTTV